MLGPMMLRVVSQQYFVRLHGPLDPIHTQPGIFENGDFFLRIRLPSTRKRHFSGTEKRGFQIRSPGWMEIFFIIRRKNPRERVSTGPFINYIALNCP